MLLRRYVWRRRGVQLVRSVAICFAAVASWLIVTSVADRYFPLPKIARFVIELGVVVLVIGILFKSLNRLWAAVPWMQSASEIEYACGNRFDGLLQTVVSQSMQPPELRGSRSFLQHLAARTNEIAAQIRPASIAPLKPIRRPAMVLGTLLLVLSFMAMREQLRLPALLMRELFPLSDRIAVTATTLQVLPGNATRTPGRPLTVVVHATGLGDSIPKLQFHEDDPTLVTAIMTPRGNDFVYRFASVDRPLTYRVVAGDAISPMYLIQFRNFASAAAARKISPTTAADPESIDAYFKAIER